MNHLQHKEITQNHINLYWYYKQKGIHVAYFERYFHHLQHSRTTFEAFNTTNAEYFDLFGENKYSCIRSFRNSLKNYLK